MSVESQGKIYKVRITIHGEGPKGFMFRRQAVQTVAAKKFAERVAMTLGDRIDSIILYGSVARGESRGDSDIDILVLGKRKSDWKEVSSVAYDMDLENSFATLISPTFYETSDFEGNADRGSLFAMRVFREGVTLFDNGIYQGIRRKVLGTG